MLKKRAFRKLYHKYFYIPKHENISEKVFNSRMTVSLLTILACVAMLVSSAFAFFSMQVSTAPSTIAAANYTVRVNSATASAYTCRLAYEDLHLFELTANGTASTGYCKVLIDDDAYYTAQIPQGQSLLLTIRAAEGTQIRFEPYWGQYATTGSAVRYASDDVIYHSETEHAVYEVQDGATIADIAAHYGVAPEDICVYNGLSDDIIALFSRPSATPQQITFSIDTPLSAGLVLKIPGVPWDTEPYTVPADKDEEQDKEDEEKSDEAENKNETGNNEQEKDETTDDDDESTNEDGTQSGAENQPIEKDPTSEDEDADNDRTPQDDTDADVSKDETVSDETNSDENNSDETASDEETPDENNPEDTEAPDTESDNNDLSDDGDDAIVNGDTALDDSSTEQDGAAGSESESTDAVSTGSAYGFR